jgi:hypothetical protein
MRSTVLLLISGIGIFYLASPAAAQPPADRGAGRGHRPDIQRALSNRSAFGQSQGLSPGRGLNDVSRPGAQAGTGRLGFDSLRQRGRSSEMRDRLLRRDQRPDVARQRFAKAQGNRPQADSGDAPVRRSDLVSHGLNRRGATLADAWLTKRLATIDHLRDVAMRNGNVQLLDRLEQFEDHAQQQYLWRTGQIDHPHDTLPMEEPLPEEPAPTDMDGQPLPDEPIDPQTLPDEPIDSPPVATDPLQPSPQPTLRRLPDTQ